MCVPCHKTFNQTSFHYKHTRVRIQLPGNDFDFMNNENSQITTGTNDSVRYRLHEVGRRRNEQNAKHKTLEHEHKRGPNVVRVQIDDNEGKLARSFKHFRTFLHMIYIFHAKTHNSITKYITRGAGGHLTDQQHNNTVLTTHV
jgi:hypothetical protein